MVSTQILVFQWIYNVFKGLAEYNRASAKLIFGDLTSKKNIVTVQAISGTGSLRVGTAFIKTILPDSTMYISDPTWGKTFAYHDIMLNFFSSEPL